MALLRSLGSAIRGQSQVAAQVGVPAMSWSPVRLFSSEKEDVKHRSSPDMGTTMQEGNESKAAGAKEAGYEKAHEAGESIRDSSSVGEAAEKTKDAASDVGSGVGQFAQKVKEMGKEAASRASETAKGLAGSDK
eukprot:jgi/Mesen1/5413/ME000269S04550